MMPSGQQLQPPPLNPTTITTLEQAYWCLFDHYVTGKTLDDRVLLTGAFTGLVQELLLKGLDQSSVMLPQLSGDRQADWQAFSTTYQHISRLLPQDAPLQQDLMAAMMEGMVRSLRDDHTEWNRPVPLPDEVKNQFPQGAAYGLGITTSARRAVRLIAPEAQPPLFLTAIMPNSPAAQKGLQPGDIITAVNGIAPFSNGQPNPGVMTWLSPEFPQSATVHLTLTRPATQQSLTVDLTPTFSAPGLGRTAQILAGSIASVRLPGFAPNAGAVVSQAIKGLNLGQKLHGIILDLRSNGGGAPKGDASLLGAFVHNKIWSYNIDRDGKLIANRTDDTMSLLNQPLVVLTSRECASACDAFASAVRDLGIGKLVGMRTSGVVSGPASPYRLNDGSVLSITGQYSLGANKEKIDGMGVAPDYAVPLTPEALSAGQDPQLEKAVSLLSEVGLTEFFGDSEQQPHPD